MNEAFTTIGGLILENGLTCSVPALSVTIFCTTTCHATPCMSCFRNKLIHQYSLASYYILLYLGIKCCIDPVNADTQTISA